MGFEERDHNYEKNSYFFMHNLNLKKNIQSCYTSFKNGGFSENLIKFQWSRDVHASASWYPSSKTYENNLIYLNSIIKNKFNYQKVYVFFSQWKLFFYRSKTSFFVWKKFSHRQNTLP